MNISIEEFLEFSKGYMYSYSSALELSINKLFNVPFKGTNNHVIHTRFPQSYNCVIEVPFMGEISGGFLIEIVEEEWKEQFFLSFELKDSDMFRSALKELLNVASSISLEKLRVKNPNLNILCPRIIFGKLYCPEHRFISSTLVSDKFSPIHCHIYFNDIIPGVI